MSKKESLATIGDILGSRAAELKVALEAEMQRLDQDPATAELSQSEKEVLAARNVDALARKLLGEALNEQHQYFNPRRLNYWLSVGVQALATTACVVGGAALAVKLTGRKQEEKPAEDSTTEASNQGNLFQAAERPIGSGRGLKSA